MILETERLILRKYSWADFEGLYEILSDPETMAHNRSPMTRRGSGGGSNGAWTIMRSTALACGPWS